MAEKKRLDELLLAQRPEFTRNQLQSFIMQGQVTVDGQVITKAGTPIKLDARVVLTLPEQRYVSRAGNKLVAALEYFKIDVHGLICADAGISTGGFTDCLLQAGAARVHGIDVAYGQVHEKIRSNPRVILHERTNLRTVSDLGELVDLVTLDLSFISITKVLDAVCAILKPGGLLITLIKPQFEAGKEQIGRGGIVRDTAVHEQVVATVTAAICARGFVCRGVIPSPITGTMGNQEFIACFVRQMP
jgi:23S rRNA (cytidine1920-2'-O)/16S rRNA (cytidine1409-2'-O)-methyltransferase